jgi:hypothetical protein
MKRWWNGLTNKGRLLTGAGGVAALLIAISLVAPQSDDDTASADAAAQRRASASPSQTASPTPTPVVTTETVDVSEAIPFDTVTVDDAGRDVGQDAVTTTGQDGTRIKTYEVTYTDGVETSRSLASEAIAAPPVQQITSRGTRQPYVAPAPAPAPAAQGCDSNYSGACVPIASDVDCDGGSGNGPAYVRGPVTVVGYDIYDLDRDGDGIACD